MSFSSISILISFSSIPPLSFVDCRKSHIQWSTGFHNIDIKRREREREDCGTVHLCWPDKALSFKGGWKGKKQWIVAVYYFSNKPKEHGPQRDYSTLSNPTSLITLENNMATNTHHRNIQLHHIISTTTTWKQWMWQVIKHNANSD